MTFGRTSRIQGTTLAILATCLMSLCVLVPGTGTYEDAKETGIKCGLDATRTCDECCSSVNDKPTCMSYCSYDAGVACAENMTLACSTCCSTRVTEEDHRPMCKSSCENEKVWNVGKMCALGTEECWTCCNRHHTADVMSQVSCESACFVERRAQG